MKRIPLWAAAAALSVTGMWAVPASAADELVLGLSMGKTGRYKTSSETTETSVDLAVAEINAAGGVNGRKIKIVKFDTGGDPKQAQVAARTLAEDHNALAIIGPFSSSEAAVAFGAGERLEIVQIPNASSAPGLTKGKPFAFRFTEGEGKQFARLMKTMKAKGIAPRKAAVLYVSDDRVMKIVGSKLMPALMGKFGIEVSDPIGFQLSTFDLAPLATKALAATPDAVGVAALPEGAMKALKEMRRQGFKGRMIGSQLFADPNNQELFGEAGEGTIFAAGFWWDQNDETRAFRKKFDAENARRGIKKEGPHHVDAQAYDTVYLFAEVMKKANVTGDAAKVKAERVAIRDALKGIRFDGIMGKGVCFDENGDAELGAFIIEIKNSTWTKFDEHPADDCK